MCKCRCFLSRLWRECAVQLSMMQVVVSYSACRATHCVEVCSGVTELIYDVIPVRVHNPGFALSRLSRHGQRSTRNRLFFSIPFPPEAGHRGGQSIIRLGRDLDLTPLRLARGKLTATTDDDGVGHCRLAMTKLVFELQQCKDRWVCTGWVQAACDPFVELLRAHAMILVDA